MFPLSPFEYGELKMDIMERGVMVPIEFDEKGNVLDGYHRLKICKELGIEDYPRVVRTGMSEEDKRTHARKLNMARRQITQEQRREIIRQQLMDTPEKSDRQIAAGLGVSNKTVSSQRKEMEASGELCKVHSSIGADGKERPRHPMYTPQKESFPPDPDQLCNLHSSTEADDMFFWDEPKPLSEEPSPDLGQLCNLHSSAEADNMFFQNEPELPSGKPSLDSGQLCNLHSSTEADDMPFEDEPEPVTPETDFGTGETTHASVADKLHDAIFMIQNVPHDEAAFQNLKEEINSIMREIYINGLNEAIERLTLFRDRIQDFEGDGQEKIEYSKDYNQEGMQDAD